MKAIKTKYVSATATKPSRIRASAEGVPSKFYSVYQLEGITQTDRAEAWHGLAALKFRDENHWKLPLASGQIGPDDHVHCFVEHVCGNVPVTAALLAELADIRDRGNSPKVAGAAFIEAQKGFGPSPAHLEQLRETLPKPRVFTVVSVSVNANAFGLKGVRVITEDGTGFECLYQAYGPDPVPERGDKIPENCLSTYLRRDLPKSNPHVAVAVIAGIKTK